MTLSLSGWKRSRAVVLGLLAVFAAVAMEQPAGAAGLRKIVFAMSWSPTDHHAPYWVALDKGYYAREGFDVEIQYSKGSGDSTAKVDTNRAEFAITEAVTAIAAISRGAKIKIIGIVFSKSPMAFFVWNDSPIRTVTDLAGKTIGEPPGAAERVLFPALAKINHLDPASVKWVNIDTAATVGALTAKRVDAVGDYTTILPLYEKAMGKGNVRMIPWLDFGLNLYSVTIIARDDTIAKEPDMVRRFLRATYEGWRDAAKDPEEAIRIFKKHVPEINIDLVRAAFEGITLGLVKTPAFETHGIGWIDPQRMCQTVNVVDVYMKVPRQVACKEVYDDQLLPVIHFAK